ncbi:AsmA family protein [Hansschlegelia zhihuaiae]|uniref:AsmA family protein n=1 Tax=Hansschlegelia zhihuaiae TaxID=405005 RepID=A0A4Q0MJT7_9HYPH|nr:AsmA family protein [Hansschlegelia zhihuaiae]RXF73379.1 AsmA family protein [Hansschlegelia zhihuaiae]
MSTRRILFGLAAAVALAAASGAVALSRVSVDDAGERLIGGLRDATGLSVAANGAATVSLFPSPRLRVDGVSFARRGEPPFAVARELVGALRLPALLLGRVELGEITLSEPQIALDRLPYADVLAALQARKGVGHAPSIRIADGRLGWGGRAVDRVEAGLAWPRDGGPLAFSGYGRLGGRPVEATLQLADLAAFGRGERAPFRARLEGGGLRVMFDGDAIGVASPRLTGEISARAASLADALDWLGARAAGRGASQWSASFAGRGGLDADGLQISNAEIDLAGRSFLGAGRLTSVNGQPAVEATLDAGDLDLTPFAATLSPRLGEPDGSWSEAAIDLDGLRGWSLDLRLSAEALEFGGLRLGETAATMLVANGGLDLSIGEAAAYGGVIGGRLSLEPKGAETRLRLEGAATGVMVENTLAELLAKPPIEGSVNADLAVESVGTSVAGLVAGLKGRASGHLADGALESASRSRTLALAGLRGRMPVSRADIRMAVEGGVARADDISIVGPNASFALAGTASLVDRRIKLSGSVSLAKGGWDLPVVVEGPLSSPRLRPNLSGKSADGEARRGAAPDVVR